MLLSAGAAAHTTIGGSGTCLVGCHGRSSGACRCLIDVYGKALCANAALQEQDG